MARGDWTGRIGITAYPQDGDPINEEDIAAELGLARGLARGLALLVGAGCQVSGDAFESGSSVAAGSWIGFDDDGYPWFRETEVATDIAFEEGLSGAAKLYVVPALVEGVTPDLIEADLDAVTFQALDDEAEPPAHSLLLGSGTVDSGSFTDFTYETGVYQQPWNDLAGLGLEYDSDGRLALDLDIIGNGLTWDSSDSKEEVLAADGTIDVSSSGIKVKSGSITEAHLNDAVKRLLPYPTFSIGSESGHTRRISVQMVDANGGTLPSGVICSGHIWISDTDYSAVETSQTVDSWTAVSGNGGQSFLTANKSAHFGTNSSSLYQFDLKISATCTVYILVNLRGRVYSSGAVSYD